MSSQLIESLRQLAADHGSETDLAAAVVAVQALEDLICLARLAGGGRVLIRPPQPPSAMWVVSVFETSLPPLSSSTVGFGLTVQTALRDAVQTASLR